MESLTLSEVKAKAKELGISKMCKADLINVLTIGNDVIDTNGKVWEIGRKIGTGGWGTVYTCRTIAMSR
jgi:hypothetical protein